MTSERPFEQRLSIRSEADVHGAVMLCYSLLGKVNEGHVLMTELATVVSELGMNIVKYAPTGGSMWLRLLTKEQTPDKGWIEIVAEDHGPGIADLNRALQDHYSSTATLGLGLPGVRRMVDEFHIQSTVGVGTLVRAKKWLLQSNASAAPPPRLNGERDGERAGVRGIAPLQHPLHPHPCPLPLAGEGVNRATQAVAMVNRPCAGESSSGDVTLCIDMPAGRMLCIVDVLGHGSEAHDLACTCSQWLHKYLKIQPLASVTNTLLALDLAIKGSRGIAITLARVGATQVDVAGVGNTMLYCVGADKVTPLSAQPGILGGNMPRLRARQFDLVPDDLLVLTSDGISERLDSQFLLSTSRGCLQSYADAILRSFGRTHDDASCLVYRHGSASHQEPGLESGHAG